MTQRLIFCSSRNHDWFPQPWFSGWNCQRLRLKVCVYRLDYADFLDDLIYDYHWHWSGYLPIWTRTGNHNRTTTDSRGTVSREKICSLWVPAIDLSLTIASWFYIDDVDVELFPCRRTGLPLVWSWLLFSTCYFNETRGREGRGRRDLLSRNKWYWTLRPFDVQRDVKFCSHFYRLQIPLPHQC